MDVEARAEELEGLNGSTAPDFKPREAADMLGLTDKQFKYAMARLKGANKTQAARVAGYGGDDDELRSAGSKVSQSPKVIAFLKWAETEGAGIPDEPCDSAELKRILSRRARGEDVNACIRAAEVLHKINAAEVREETPSDPIETLNEIAELLPEFALLLARKFDVQWNPPTGVDIDPAVTERIERKYADGCAERAKQQVVVSS